MTRFLEQANECSDPVAGDYFWIYDASAGSTDKDRKVDVGRFAQKAINNAFSITQTIAPTAGTNALAVTTPTNQTAAGVTLSAADCGTSHGPHITINRNSNVSTPAAGFLYMAARTGTAGAIWIDNAGVVRINTGALPTNANDVSGSAIGAQTSYVGIKENITEWTDPQQALDAVLACKLFQYHLKSDATKRQYVGLVIHEEDRGAWFSENDGENQIPALNERNLFGYLIGAIQAQQAQIDALRAEIEALHARH